MQSSFYVDDLPTVAGTINAAFIIYHDENEVMKSACTIIKQKFTNGFKLQDNETRATRTKNPFPGIKWSREVRLRVHISACLHETESPYNPLGFIAPAIVQAKIIDVVQEALDGCTIGRKRRCKLGEVVLIARIVGRVDSTIRDAR